MVLHICFSDDSSSVKSHVSQEPTSDAGSAEEPVRLGVDSLGSWTTDKPPCAPPSRDILPSPVVAASFQERARKFGPPEASAESCCTPDLAAGRRVMSRSG